jgi:hypothetical protein
MLVMTSHSEFIMVTCLKEIMDKFLVVLVIHGSVLVFQDPIRWRHISESSQSYHHRKTHFHKILI